MGKVSTEEKQKRVDELNTALVGKIIDMEIIANEMWKLLNCKLDAKLMEAFTRITIPFYNAVIKTSIYRFRSLLQNGERQDNKVEYSPKAQFYVNILKSCKQLSFHNPLTFIGMKCAYCDAESSNQIPGSASFFDVSTINESSDILVTALRNRLLHLQKDCAVARQNHGDEVLSLFDTNYSTDNEDTLKQFTTLWLKEIKKNFFSINE